VPTTGLLGAIGNRGLESDHYCVERKTAALENVSPRSIWRTYEKGFVIAILRGSVITQKSEAIALPKAALQPSTRSVITAKLFSFKVFPPGSFVREPKS